MPLVENETAPGYAVPGVQSAETLVQYCNANPASAESVSVMVMEQEPEHEELLLGVKTGVATAVGDPVSDIEVLAEDPFNEAVSVAAELTVNAPVLRVNEPLDAPCGTRTDAGTVADGELDASETVAPPDPAAPLSATEQAVELEGDSEAVLQFTEVTVTGAGAGAASTD